MLKRKHSRLILFVFSLLFPSVMFAATADLLSQVDLVQGRIVGQIEDSRVTFRGIPYAQAPIGALRWKAPQVVTKGSEVLHAAQFGARCPQLSYQGVFEQDVSEDCLFINISAPIKRKTDEKLPILVWIHGGGYVGGSGNNQPINNQVWNDKGVMLITFNYRLGMLGFLAHPQIGNTDGANFGLLDMLAALQWVQDNISQFGGDPSRVTIAGGSAGGMAVQMLMSSPLAKDLFSGAISQSGYGAWPLPRVLPNSINTQDANEIGIKLINSVLNEKAQNQSLADLQTLSVESLVRAVKGFYLPIVDGLSLPDEPGIIFAQGKQQHVPYISGGNSYDGSVYPYSGVESTTLLALMGNKRQQIESLYHINDPLKHELGVENLFGDFRYVLAGSWTSSNMFKVQQPAYRYWFDYVPSDKKSSLPGAPHGSENGALFNESGHSTILAMRQYWLNFIKTGSPNGSGLPNWPILHSNEKAWLVFGDNIVVDRGVAQEKLQVLQDVYVNRVQAALKQNH